MIKVVIFDLDDTLLASRAMKWAHHKHVAKEFYDINLTDDDIREHWGKPMDELVRLLYRGKDKLENTIKNLVLVRDQFPKKIYPQTKSTLDEMISKGLKLGIVSATYTEFIESSLIENEISREKFIVVQGADKTKYHKPDGRVFEPVVELFSKEKISPNEIVYVGDSLSDFFAARDAGLEFVAVTTGLYSEEDFKKAGAEKIAEHIGEVLRYI